MVVDSRTKFNVLTLNCWDIPIPRPIGSRDRAVRLMALSEHLSSGQYDLVSLQEVWSENDFVQIKSAVQAALPFSFYFHSGFSGSGVCVFSKWPILNTLMHRYSLNGYVHHVHRGDWFGGKIVGLCIIRLNDFLINFYATHIHAEYNPDNDFYLSHRIVQAFELAQFIKTTLNFCDIAILTGDLNLTSSDIGYKIIQAHSGLMDAWCCRQDEYTPENSPSCGSTCETPGNVYTSPEVLKRWPHGKRIDYIFFESQKADVRCFVERCYPTLGSFVTKGKRLNFSDHLAVLGQFVAEKREGCNLNTRKKGYSFELDNAVPIINEGVVKVKESRKFFLILLSLSILTYIWTIDIELQWPIFVIPILFARFLLTLLIGFSLWYGGVCLTSEEKSLKATKASLELLIENRKRFSDTPAQQTYL